MVGLTMTDCSVEDNRVQARYELDKAIEYAESGWPSKAAEWAAKWGRALIEYADSAPSEDEVSDDLRRVQQEADDAGQSASERADAIRATISKLDGIVADLENAL